MFGKIRRKIEQALGRLESRRTPTRDDIDRLLRDMREELIELRARVPKLEREIERSTRAAAEQVRRAEAAHTRASQARRAGDAPTADSALAVAEQALGAAEDLRRQADELRDELDRLRSDSAERMARLKAAERDRDVLLARARRAGTSRRLEDLLSGPGSGLRRIQRVEEDIASAEDRAAAADELERSLGTSGEGTGSEAELRQLERARSAAEIDRRLAELKRQIDGKEKG